MSTIKKLLKRKTWHSIIPRKHKRPEDPADFLERIIRLAATRCSMASWGQPFEAIASWILLSKEANPPSHKASATKEDGDDE